MKKTETKVFILITLLFSGCIAETPKKDEYTTTTSFTRASSTTLQKAVSTTSPTSSTTTIITTTTFEAATTTTLPSAASDACIEKKPGIERDACYLSTALYTGNWTYCVRIEKNSTRALCLKETEVENDGRSTMVQGYVVYDAGSLPVKGARVLAVSIAGEKAMGSAETDERGFFSMDLPSRDRYRIVVKYKGGDYAQEVYARKGETYELWFRLPGSP